MISPHVMPEAFDYIKIAGRRSPGVARFPNGPPKREMGWDKQAGKGTSGAKLVKNEEPPVEFDVEFELKNDDDHEAYNDWKPVFLTPSDVTTTVQTPLPQAYLDDVAAQRTRANALPPAEKKSRIADLDAQVADKKRGLTSQKKEQRALDISHPFTAEIDCKAVVLKAWIPPYRKKPGGSEFFRITFLESRPLTGVGSGTVNGSIVGGGNPRNGVGNGPDPNQARKDAVAAKSREAGFV